MDPNGALAAKAAQVLALLDLPWPGGDPVALRRLARAWRSAADQLVVTADGLDAAVASVVGSGWRGAAADAFAAHWRRQHASLHAGARTFRQVGTELDAYADEAEQILQAIAEIALEIAEFELAGLFLTFLTAGLSDVIATAAAGERALRIVQLIDRFIRLAVRAERALSRLLDALRDLGLLPRIAVDSGKTAAMNLLGTQLTDVFTGKGWADGQELETAAVAGLGVGVGGAALDRAGGAVGGRVGRLLHADSTAQQITVGGVSGAAATAGTDALQGRDAHSVVADTLTGAAAGAAGAGFASGVPSAREHHAPLGWELAINGAVFGESGAMESALDQAPDPAFGP